MTLQIPRLGFLPFSVIFLLPVALSSLLVIAFLSPSLRELRFWGRYLFSSMCSFSLGVAGASDTADSLTGISTFFGDGFAPCRPVFFAGDCFFVTFFTGVAAFGVAIFLPLRVVFPVGVAGALVTLQIP